MSASMFGISLKGEAMSTMHPVVRKAFERSLASSNSLERGNAVEGLCEVVGEDSFEMLETHFQKEQDSHPIVMVCLAICRRKDISAERRMDLLLPLVDRINRGMGYIARAIQRLQEEIEKGKIEK